VIDFLIALPFNSMLASEVYIPKQFSTATRTYLNKSSGRTFAV